MEEEVKVSELPVASNVNDDDLIMIVQDGFNKIIEKENLFSDTEQEIENLEEQATELQNQINDKNLITIGLNADTTTTSTSAYQTIAVPLTKQMGKIGNKLTLVSGKVKIGEGVSNVLVSGKIQTQGDNQSYGLHIRKNNTNVASCFEANLNAGWNQLAISPILIAVSENDLIDFAIYHNANNSTKYIKAYDGVGTYMTVEAIN